MQINIIACTLSRSRELEEPPPPLNRYPGRPPETEEEIQAAIAWLRSRGYLPPPTVPVPSPVQATKPAPPERSSRSGGWGLIWMVIGGFFLWALLHNQSSQTSASRSASRSAWAPSSLPAFTQSQPVEVRRALPVVPRALPVTSGISTVSNAAWQPIRMPDGTIVNVSYQGQLPSSAALPPQGTLYRRGVLDRHHKLGLDDAGWSKLPFFATMADVNKSCTMNCGRVFRTSQFYCKAQ